MIIGGIVLILIIVLILGYVKRTPISNWLYKKYGEGDISNPPKTEESQRFIIISSEKLRNIFYKEKEKKVYPYFFVLSIGFTLMICWIETTTFNKIGSISSENVKTSVLVISLVFLLVGIALLFLNFYKNKNAIDAVDWDGLLKEIQNQSNNRLERNLIFLFATKEKDVLKFLVQRKESWHRCFFFPHIEDIYSDNLNHDKKAIKDAVKSAFSIPRHLPIDLSFLPSIDFDSIKNNAHSIPQQFHFRYIFVSSKFPFLNKILNKYLLEEPNGFEYRSVPELIEDRASFNNNRDVIEQLQSHLSSVKDAFKEKIEDKPAKIIWNIDKRCNRNCDFCAYGSFQGEKPLSLNQNKKIVDTIKDLRVTEIDFALGDNAEIDDVIEIIKYAQKTLQQTNISLTATSAVVNKILSQKKNILTEKKLVRCVDISIDTVNDSDEIDKMRSSGYNLSNLEVAKKLIEKGVRVKIQTVITSNTTYDTIKNLIYKLKEFGINEILLLRLMPVGKMGKDNYPPQLIDKGLYEDLLNKIKEIKDFKIRWHCSLRGLVDDDIYCNMGCQKLGIGMNGDVFVCPWAEHLSPENNPFRIGNLRNVSKMEELFIDNENYINAINNKNLSQPHCKIFSFVFNNDAYGKHDKLYLNK